MAAMIFARIFDNWDKRCWSWRGNGNYDAGQDRKSYQMQMLVFQKLFFRNSIKAKVVGCISICNLENEVDTQCIYQVVKVHKSFFSNSVLDSKNFIATSAIDSKKFRSSSTVTLSLISSEIHILNYCTMLQKLSKCEVKDWLCWIWSFYCHSNFTWNQILANSNGPKWYFCLF